jgi:hypothetical protein
MTIADLGAYLTIGLGIEGDREDCIAGEFHAPGFRSVMGGWIELR